MIGTTRIHIAGGMIALVSGAGAVAVRKGSGMHVSAGTWKVVAGGVTRRALQVDKQASQNDGSKDFHGSLTR